MRLKDISDLSNVIAAAAVVLSLLVVAWQISKNTAAIEANSNLSMNSLNADLYTWVQNRDFADVLIRADGGIDELDPAEALQFASYVSQFLSVYEQGLMLHELGLMGDVQWTAWDEGTFGAINRPGPRSVWDQIKSAYTPNFRNHIDSMYENADRGATLP